MKDIHIRNVYPQRLNLVHVFLSIDCQTYICDFHREQAWERWLAKTSNGLVSSKQAILAKLRSIAKARTEVKFNEKVEDLKSTEEWKANQNLRNWIGNTWLPQYKVGNVQF